VGLNTSIAVDSSNNVHIGYYDETNHDLRYATNASGSWVIQTVDSAGYVGHDISIAVDSNNKVHISYYNDVSGDLKYVTNSTGSWVIQAIDKAVYVGVYNSIAVDSNNKVHISYHDATNYDLKYATVVSGSWVTQTIDNEGFGYTSIAEDSNNNVHISYTGYYTDLKYATNASGSWVTQTIDSAGYTGTFTSIAVDSDNKVHISYGDWNNGWNNFDLKYATNATGSWAIQTIDSVGDVGKFNSIAVDSNKMVHISYHDATNGDLKYATNASGSWVIQTIDSAGDVGGYNSIAVDSSNKVHISYCDWNNGDLKYATSAWGSWVTQTVDSAGNAGTYTSIAVDSNNKMHISYLGGTYEDLKYATNASGSWVTQTIDSAGYAGGPLAYTSIAMDSNNKVHISYHDAANGDLKYATNASVYAALTILSPNGGEVIPSGSTYTITWSAPSEAVKFDIGYSLDDGAQGTWKLIASNITSYSYNWTVPAPDGNKNTCRAGVRGYNASGGVVGTDTSNNPFTIEVIKLTDPDGGEILTSGTTYQIRWQTNSTIRPVQTVKIYGSPNEGQSGTWRLLTTINGNPGYYDWTVPSVGSIKDKCRLGVLLLDSTSANIGQDGSDNNFTIQP
jgi:hypothetical protein